MSGHGEGGGVVSGQDAGPAGEVVLTEDEERIVRICECGHPRMDHSNEGCLRRAPGGHGRCSCTEPVVSKRAVERILTQRLTTPVAGREDAASSAGGAT